ncbi:hypothetical protein AK812_SmicGene45794, partial [Symbiodinium microadriaticum]
SSDSAASLRPPRATRGHRPASSCAGTSKFPTRKHLPELGAVPHRSCQRRSHRRRWCAIQWPYCLTCGTIVRLRLAQGIDC